VPPRVNEKARKTTWSAFHRAKTSAPRRPFERPARASPGSAAWPPRCRSSMPFNSRESPCGASRKPGSRPRARLPAGSRLSEPRASFADFCNRCRRAGTPERAVCPRTRVRLSPRYSLAPTDASCVGPSAALPRGGPASRALRAPAFARCAPLAWTGQFARAEALERRSMRALLTKSRVPSSLRSGHPGHRFELSPGLENLGTARTGRDPSWMQPRERPHRRESRGAFCRAGILTRAEDCSSVRAWTAPPSRGLRGGFARGDARLCFPLEAPSSDEDSASCGLDPPNQGEPKPRWNDESQRPSRHLRPNQLAG